MLFQFLDLMIFSVTLAGVGAGVLAGFDLEDVQRLFQDGGAEVVQLFVIQYFLYLGVLEGVVVNPVLLVAVVLPSPLLVSATLKRRQAKTSASGLSRLSSF
ncbi:MAG: hypothetical protein QW767_04030 [Thermoprotei archaeon]